MKYIGLIISLCTSLRGTDVSDTYRSAASGQSIQSGAHVHAQHFAKVLVAAQQTCNQRCAGADQRLNVQTARLRSDYVQSLGKRFTRKSSGTKCGAIIITPSKLVITPVRAPIKAPMSEPSSPCECSKIDCSLNAMCTRYECAN